MSKAEASASSVIPSLAVLKQLLQPEGHSDPKEHHAVEPDTTVCQSWRNERSSVDVLPWPLLQGASLLNSCVAEQSQRMAHRAVQHGKSKHRQSRDRDLYRGRRPKKTKSGRGSQSTGQPLCQCTVFRNWASYSQGQQWGDQVLPQIACHRQEKWKPPWMVEREQYSLQSTDTHWPSDTSLHHPHQFPARGCSVQWGTFIMRKGAPS